MNDRVADVRARLSAYYKRDARPYGKEAQTSGPAFGVEDHFAYSDIEWLLAEVNAMRVVIAELRGEVRDLEAVAGIASAHGNADPSERVYQNRGAP